MKRIIYIDDNKNNISLMRSVLESYSPSTAFIGTDSPEEFLNASGSGENLYIIDYTLDGILGDQLYEKLLEIDPVAQVIIISSGYISDLQDIFMKFSFKPLAITDRFGAIDVLKGELEKIS